MPDQDYQPATQTVSAPKGDEVIFPFVADVLHPVAGYTFQATYLPWGGQPTRLTCDVNEGTNTVSVTVSSVDSGSLTIRRFSGGAHQRTVAVVTIVATNPEVPRRR